MVITRADLEIGTTQNSKFSKFDLTSKGGVFLVTSIFSGFKGEKTLYRRSFRAKNFSKINSGDASAEFFIKKTN